MDAEVQSLDALDLEGLRRRWREGFGPAPTLRSAELLRRLLAWKLQAAAYGCLDAETKRLLRQRTSSRLPALQPGARLAREWKGVRHEVEVTEQGFAYAGATYSSLSEVARRIAGSRWNGPRFFGLRDERAS